MSLGPRTIQLRLLAPSVAALVLCSCGSATHSLSTSSTSSTTLRPQTTVTTATTGTNENKRNSDWTTYHGGALSSGVDTSGVKLDSPHQAWSSPTLDGELFGEPLVVAGVVYVATENDTVYALSASAGTVIWSTHLGTPVNASQLSCGDIDPFVGITSTPVIDTRRAEIFVLADEQNTSSGASHHLVGLNLRTGKTELDQIVNPPGTSPLTELQRTGLALDDGRVVFGFGGNYGDCGYYHGYVVSVPETGGSEKYFEVDSALGNSEGAIWMGGGSPVVDSSGDVWVSAGNGSVRSGGSPYDNSDSVLELSPSMTLLQYFAPGSWASDNATDLDLGSTSPAYLSNGTVLQVGKAGIGYLLRRTSLGGIGGELTSATICSSEADGGDAVDGSVVYVPCAKGVTAVTVSTSPPGLSVLWATSSASSGPPVVAGGFVWSIDSGGTLWALDPADGSPRFHFALGGEANHFPTPSVGDGMLFAPAADRVFAFSSS